MRVWHMLYMTVARPREFSKSSVFAVHTNAFQIYVLTLESVFKIGPFWVFEKCLFSQGEFTPLSHNEPHTSDTKA